MKNQVAAFSIEIAEKVVRGELAADDKQKALAEKYIEKLNADGDGPIVTTLEPASKFYAAEEYHQDYFARNPNAGYCRAVVRNKVRKFNREFGDKIKKKGE